MSRVSDLRYLEALAEGYFADPGRRERLARAVHAGEVCVLDDHDDVVGFAWIQPQGFFGHTFVNLLIVRQDRRRRGHAGRLLVAAEKRATSDRLFTSTNVSNDAMQAVCAAYGWRRCGEIDALDPGDPELVYVKFVP